MYYLIQTTWKTNEFIEKYLSEEESVLPSHRNPDIINRRWKEINDDFNHPDIKSDHIKDYILLYYPKKNRERYNKFLKTYYWIIIADKVKLDADFKCQLWKGHDNSELVAHHNDYANIHGEELQKHNELICLCKYCHEKHHNNEQVKEKEPIEIEKIVEVEKIVVQKEIVEVEKIVIQKEIVEIEKLISEDDRLESIDEIQYYTNFKLSKILNSVKKKNYRLKL